MKKIAIFVSGPGEAAERVVKLFNEGNRVRTVLVVAHESAQSFIENLRGEEDLKIIEVSEEEWLKKKMELSQLLRAEEVRLIALDNFDLAIPDEVMEAVDGEVIKLTSYDLAPREVVNALEADLRNPVEDSAIEKKEEENGPSLESEWADTLKIQYNPPKVPQTPPSLPGNMPNQPQYSNGRERQPPFNSGSQGRPYFTGQNYSNQHGHHEHHDHQEPMPSTWLIWSILVTVFCCFIPGIIAIIFSSQVSSRYYAGDFDGARRASRNAEAWIIVSVVLGVLAATLYIPFMLIGF